MNFRCFCFFFLLLYSSVINVSADMQIAFKVALCALLTCITTKTYLMFTDAHDICSVQRQRDKNYFVLLMCGTKIAVFSTQLHSYTVFCLSYCLICANVQHKKQNDY